MNFREEEKQKSGCPSRGLGIAAAAIGVGVGAALYYFFSKRPENPHGEGSTEPGWRSEPFGRRSIDIGTCSMMDVDSDEYTTISESTTSDTSVYDQDYDTDVANISISSNGSNDTDDIEIDSSGDIDDQELWVDFRNSDFTTFNPVDTSFTLSTSAGYVTDAVSVSSLESISDMSDWDMIRESDGVPVYTSRSSVMDQIFHNIRPIYRTSRRNNSSDEGVNLDRERAFRDRPWTSEECSICFELITLNQEVMTMPCTHRFHQACILPWLQEKETCPNCRRRAD